MGKYAATRAFNNDRKRGDFSFSGSVGYYLDLPKDESQFRTQSFLYGVDPTGLYSGWINQRDVNNYWNDYFKNTGLTWADVKYPSRMYGFGSEGSYAKNAVNFVSRNITRLYL